jgi:hypothetical protein
MVGQKYGSWTVLEQVYIEQNRATVFKYYECECECGAVKPVRATDLKHGRSTRCRECRDKDLYIDPKEYIGKKFGKWTVISEGIPTKAQQRTIICKCECGKELTMSTSRMKIRRPKSCQVCNVKIHGMEGTPTYYTWQTMKARCLDEDNHNYKSYGGRGIKICERWLTFKSFFEDMGEKPKGYQIDRIDNNGNYEPGNCRWVTPKENSNNRRKRPVVWNLKK